MSKPEKRSVSPGESHVTAYSGIIRKTEGRHQRNSAGKDLFVSYPGSDQFHGADHLPCSGLLFISKGSCCVQKVQLQKIKAPVVHRSFNGILNILQALRDIDIKSIETSPVAAAAERSALFISDHPVRMLLQHTASLCSSKRRHPEPGHEAGIMDHVRQCLHSFREFLRIGLVPVSYLSLPAIVHLEQISLL